jgi:hypothetical protein
VRVNPDIDDLIREAVRRQEMLAVDPDHIRAALPARAARRRTRTRVTLATVAAAVAIAVTVPIIVMRDNGNSDEPATSSTAGPSQAGAPLYYRPTWLPAGMVERRRSVSIHGALEFAERYWKRASADDSASGQQIILTTKVRASTEEPAPNVDINGTPGWYDDIQSSMSWQVDEDTKLTLMAPELGLSKEVLLRIARSVTPDPTRMRLPLRLDWVPDGVADQRLQVRGDSPTTWKATILSADDKVHYLAVSVGTAADTASGETVTINGHTAQLAQVDEKDAERPSYRTKWLLTMDLGDGRQLTVRSGSAGYAAASELTRDDIIRIAEHVQVDADPDLAWLGR